VMDINVEEKRVLELRILDSDEHEYKFSLNTDGYFIFSFNEKSGLDIFERITDLLQTEGFNLDYSPNNLGKTLEKLIDKFQALDY